MLLVMDKVNTSYKQQKMCLSPKASHIQNEAICKAWACNTGRIQNLDCKKRKMGKQMQNSIRCAKITCPFAALLFKSIQKSSPLGGWVVVKIQRN